MKTWIGVITKITELDPNNTGHQKRKVVLQENNKESVSIDFKGNMLIKLEKYFKVNDPVIITAENKHNESSNNLHFNNIYAKEIEMDIK
tara:strand:+ start:14021 stop:14287 length:267 start_codon:yes stop_codon:yes gene_type:complete